MIVDLAVERDDIPSARRVHRLGTGRAEIEDRQSPVSQRDPGRGIVPVAFGIRAAVTQCGGHRRNLSGTFDRIAPAAEIHDPGQSAHQRASTVSG